MALPEMDLNERLPSGTQTKFENRVAWAKSYFIGGGRAGGAAVGRHFARDRHDLTDTSLKVERFYKPRMINDMMASADDPIKTFPLRGIKDSPPYLHHGRLLTLEDSVEFFNLVLETCLTAAERADLVAFMRAL